MQGDIWTKAAWLFLLSPMLGCGDARPATTERRSDPHSVQVSAHFDPSACGAIQGRVLWSGPFVEVPPFQVRTNRFPGKGPLQGLIREMPNVPWVERSTRSVAEAVIFLRGVDPAQARAWDHSPVRVEQRDARMQLYQGETEVRAGFVRRGEAIAVASRDGLYYAVHGSGADYFTFALIDKNIPRPRRMEQTGIVELSSAAGHYWMRGYVFVDDHPYYARTDKNGRFRLDRVPAGQYELVCWLPNWKVVRHERDPESSLISRVFLAAPLERTATVTVSHGSERNLDFRISVADFPQR